MTDVRTIFFIGKPGSGKGTQAKLLAEHTGWSIFGSGDEFRKIATELTPIGRKIKKEVVEGGLLAPHWFAMYLYLKAIFSVPEQQSVIFDGFNRKVPEAELVVGSLNWLGRPFSIIYIEVSDRAVRERLEGRQSTSGRADDHVVEERLKEFYTYTTAAVEMFRGTGTLVEINGEQMPEKIAEDIRAALHIK
ncbi:nucleoside monophosphate kinase [Candidatus Kaiserbacteria bacterium]|nr:nucleoside monophosphate kinase [Candidatus Kaiserbacteria bacterium]